MVGMGRQLLGELLRLSLLLQPGVEGTLAPLLEAAVILV